PTKTAPGIKVLNCKAVGVHGTGRKHFYGADDNKSSVVSITRTGSNEFEIILGAEFPEPVALGTWQGNERVLKLAGVSDGTTVSPPLQGYNFDYAIEKIEAIDGLAVKFTCKVTTGEGASYWSEFTRPTSPGSGGEAWFMSTSTGQHADALGQQE